MGKSPFSASICLCHTVILDFNTVVNGRERGRVLTLIQEITVMKF